MKNNQQTLHSSNEEKSARAKNDQYMVILLTYNNTSRSR